MAGTPWRATLSTANLSSLEALLRPGKRPTALAARFGRTPRVVGGGNPAHSATKLVQQGGKQLGSMACPMPQKHARSGPPLRGLFQTAPLVYEPAVRSLQPLFILAISKGQRQPLVRSSPTWPLNSRGCTSPSLCSCRRHQVPGRLLQGPAPRAARNRRLHIQRQCLRGTRRPSGEVM